MALVYTSIYDSEQTVVILPMEHLDFPNHQGYECQMHVVASSCFIAFISVCIFQFFLTDSASSMQMICSIFKVFVFLPAVFCRLGSWFCWITYIAALFSVFVLIPRIQFPQKKFVYIFVFLIQLKWKCDGVWGRVELNSESAITVTSFWFE
jgi:hypothetical protein